MLQFLNERGTLRLQQRRHSRKKLLKAFLIALSCHILFFSLFVTDLSLERFETLSPPILAIVDDPT